jgi:signal transduction histidine kinase
VRAPLERELRSRFFVLAGALGGAVYAALNVTMDDVARRGGAFASFPAVHFVIDRIVPVAVGLLLGTAVHYLRLRSALARAAAEDASQLRERLDHTERDQAVWVVAAATLHEAKNPLHAMGLLLEELDAQTELSADSRTLTQKLRGQWTRVLAPLDTLKAMTRQGDPGTGHPSDAVDAIVQRALRTFVDSHAIQQKKLTVVANRSRARVPAIPVRIAVENLLANALDEATDVELEVSESGEGICIDVRDNGPGISDESQLFRPHGSEKRAGLGLGLPIARALVRALGGDVVYLRKGNPPRTVFRLTLPRTP